MLRVSGGGVGGILGRSRKPLEVKPVAAALFVEFRNSSVSSSGQTCRRGWHPVSSRSASVLGVCACVRAHVSLSVACVWRLTQLFRSDHTVLHTIYGFSRWLLSSPSSPNTPPPPPSPRPPCVYLRSPRWLRPLPR